MAIPLVINGVTFQYPQQFDKNWAPTLTNWSSAVTSGMLQKAGGAFTLTSEVDFGGSFGMKVLSVKSEESNIAATGFLRLANASAGIVWRNATNGADLALTVNSSNQLTFNGTSIGATTSLTNGHILVGNVSNQPADVAMSGDITITNAGVTAIGAGKVLNAAIGTSAAIALSKLAALSASKLAVTDGSGFLTTQSSPTLTELGYVGGVTSAIQTQLNSITSSYLPLSGGTMSGAINMASHKITSVANAASASDAVAFGQLVTNNIVGTTTNDSATPGYIGEVMSVSSSANNPFPTSNDYGNTGSLALTAGDWMICAQIRVNLNGATVAAVEMGVSTVSGNSNAGLVSGDNYLVTQASTSLTFQPVLTIANYHVQLASPTTYYMKIMATYISATPVYQYRFNALRIR